MTEVGSSGLTKLLISRENELGLLGSPRGGPSEGRAGNQRDQRESSDKYLHDTSPCLDHVLDLCISVEAAAAECGNAGLVAMGARTVMTGNNSGGRRAGPDSDRAQRVEAGFLLVAETIMAVGYGCRFVSTDGATPACRPDRR